MPRLRNGALRTTRRQYFNAEFSMGCQDRSSIFFLILSDFFMTCHLSWKTTVQFTVRCRLLPLLGKFQKHCTAQLTTVLRTEGSTTGEVPNYHDNQIEHGRG